MGGLNAPKSFGENILNDIRKKFTNFLKNRHLILAVLLISAKIRRNPLSRGRAFWGSQATDNRPAKQVTHQYTFEIFGFGRLELATGGNSVYDFRTAY
jgi:hypothetical protein